MTDDELRAAERRRLWECPDCGFEMHRRHHDDTRPDPCPACAELRLRARLAESDDFLKDMLSGHKVPSGYWYYGARDLLRRHGREV